MANRVDAGEYLTGAANTSRIQSSESHDARMAGLALQQALRSALASDTTGLLLSDEDIAIYERIFAVQNDADWKTANTLIQGLGDRRLVGHALYQRYMHPTAYKADYEELRTWLKKYADLPQAGRVHSLALKRQPKGMKSGPALPNCGVGISGGLPAAAVQANTRNTLWAAGLDAWKLRDYSTAYNNFKTLAQTKNASGSEKAAGAFWAARALTRMGQPAEVSKWLQMAASYHRTFYGLVASRQLGQAADLNWSMPKLSASQLQALGQHPAGKRAIALLQIGEISLAEDELRNLHPKGDDEAEAGLVTLATMANMPNLAFRVAAAVTSPDGELYDSALYPMPQWTPANGFAVDRSLIFALVRQESKFETDAKSHVGATGLMQLMPRTANYIATKVDYTLDENTDLADPTINLSLGQSYVSYLLARPEVENNLLYMLAAYNSGPGQLSKWKREMGAMKDPLLFIETLPAGETRDFVRRVLANYWIYQLQLDQATNSLDAVAAGDWPFYTAQEQQPVRVADNAIFLN